MRTLFADAFYWVAVFHPGDAWHQRALDLSRALQPFQVVATEEVLTEFLNFYSSAGPAVRKTSVEFVQALQSDSGVEIINQSHESFGAGLRLFSQRQDKGYSLTDCISMTTMRARGLSEVLTHDHHFVQEGFVVLLP